MRWMVYFFMLSIMVGIFLWDEIQFFSSLLVAKGICTKFHPTDHLRNLLFHDRT